MYVHVMKMTLFLGWTFGIRYLNPGLSPPSLQPQIDSPKSWIYFPYPHIITTIKYSNHLITNYDAIIPIHDLQGCEIGYEPMGWFTGKINWFIGLWFRKKTSEASVLRCVLRRDGKKSFLRRYIAG
ncbi:hypothetical protein Hanom_Chr14g01268481 [Helianthus anomalus]